MRSLLAMRWFAAVLAMLPAVANGGVVASSDLAFGQLSISPQVQLGGPWALEAFANANNSIGGADFQDHFSASPDAISAAAAVVWATSAASTSAPNDRDLDVSGSANTTAAIPGCVSGAAFADPGLGTLTNTFSVTGAGPTVDVLFSIDVSGSLAAATGACGVTAETDATFRLDVDGGSVLFFTDALQLIGANLSDSRSFAQVLAATVALAPGDHFLLLQADSESRVVQAVIPEPAALLLACAGLAACVTTHRRRSGRWRRPDISSR